MVNYIWLGMIVVGVLVALETLRRGAQKAREAGAVYLERARRNVGLDYWK